MYLLLYLRLSAISQGKDIYDRLLSQYYWISMGSDVETTVEPC